MGNRTTPCPRCACPKQATADLCKSCRAALRDTLTGLAVRGAFARRAEQAAARALAAKGDADAQARHRRELHRAMARAHGVTVVRGEG